MPKIVDHELRRRELAQAVWRVIQRDGVDAASVRTIAGEAGWSPSALRHYFSTQSELLALAMQLVAERVEARVVALESAGDAREQVEQRLRELLPLDDERRAENEVWLAFAARALVDRELRALYEQVHDALRNACALAVEALIGPSRDRAALAELETEHLHALIDGVAVHAALRPDATSPERIVALLAAHLDALEPRLRPGVVISDA